MSNCCVYGLLDETQGLPLLQLVLDDLERQRLSLCKELEKAAARQPRTDYVDCWNLIDEIGEHDRRIGVLKEVIAESSARQAEN